MVLIWILVLPALAALISLLPLGRRAAPIATSTAALAGVGLTSQVAIQVALGGEVVTVRDWISCDALAAIVLWLVSFVGLAAAVSSWGYLDRLVPVPPARKVRRYYAGFNLFLLSILAVPILAEVAMVWIAVALTTLLSAFLVSFDGTPEALDAAWKYVILTSLGAVIALFGIFLLYWAATTAGVSAFSWEAMTDGAASMSPALTLTAFLFLLVGLGTKVGLVPLHAWLPDAYSQAPSPICALLSGGETTAVLYVLLRLLPVLAHGGVHAGGWLTGFGLLSTAVAALLLVQAQDIKRLFAFSTIEHMGIILVAAGLASEAGGLGALYQMVGHSLAKSLCFFAAGLTIAAAGSREINSIRGLVRSSPVAGVSLLVGGLAISGVPPCAVFIGELSIFRAGLKADHFVVVSLLALFVVVAFCAVMMRVNRMVFGEPAEGGARRRPSLSSGLALVMVALPLVVLGLYLPAPLHILLQAAAHALGGS